MAAKQVTVDGNEAAAFVAFNASEVIAIYPITPSSPMGELADQWSASGVKNLWGSVPRVIEMQSEAGAAGAIHGALQTGALATTFTASQGLLLMIPNMYKIAGELTSAVFHVAARTVATHALSIFGDHSDVMAARATGWAMLFSGSVQEVMDLALVAHASTLKARVPFMHAFDGFRTSHELMKVQKLDHDDIRALIDDDLVRAHRARSLSPDHPFVRGTAQNPDVFFQSREAGNPFYLATPYIVQEAMDRLAQRTGRQYRLFDYVGAPDADRVIIAMGSGSETAHETVEHLVARGEKVGLLKVRLYRPFSARHMVEALPRTVRRIAALDRTKEPGASGEPLYLDVVASIAERMNTPQPSFEHYPLVFGGRYGLSSKEFTPAMVKGVFDELSRPEPKNHFSVGVLDDVTHNSVEYDPAFVIERDDEVRALFWGLGSDGTVSANKNSIKIIGEDTPSFAQGHFVYDSRKAGARTVSHLRFGPRPIRSAYLIQKANFVAVHNFGFLERYDVLETAEPGASLLLNSPFAPDKVWDRLPRPVQDRIIALGLKVYAIDAFRVARETGMGARINTIMQPCFFSISGVLPKDEAIARIKEAIEKTYGKRGKAVVESNFAAVDAALAHLHQVKVPERANSATELRPSVPAEAPEFVQRVTATIIGGRGDSLPVSALPVDGTYPSGTTRWERATLAQQIPVWETDLCIQCGKCVLICPHAAIRAKVAPEKALADAPATLKSADARWRELPGMKYVLQVAPEDCTDCVLCVAICPVSDKQDKTRLAINMRPLPPILEEEKRNWEFFLSLPELSRQDSLTFNNVKNVQLLQPLFEFSGACAGCGETPYLKLLSQLFGDRAIISNATGCSSIYGGNLPTTPWTSNAEGRGPAWSNSLFEDTAEFGLGMRLALDKQAEYARELVDRLREEIGPELADEVTSAPQKSDAEIEAQRRRVAEMKGRLKGMNGSPARDLLAVADSLARKSVWIVGGDGWAYDIGYGGLDHVLASGRNVKILVLDTEVYSNTGGQASKATPLGAVAKFAAGGKTLAKKDLGMMAMTYGHPYVAQVAMGANDTQTLKAFQEAEAFDGPSLIIAYSPCIEHGIPMDKGAEQSKLAVDSGHWILYRYDPRAKAQGRRPLQLDSRGPRIPFKEYAGRETRYRILARTDPDGAERLMEQAQEQATERWRRYAEMAGRAK